MTSDFSPTTPPLLRLSWAVACSVFLGLVLCGKTTSGWEGIDASTGSNHVGLTETESTAGTDLRIGFEGKYRVGLWTPLRLRIPPDAAQASRVEVRLADDEGMLTSTRWPISPGEDHVTTYVKFGRLTGGLELRWLDADGRLLTQRIVTDREVPDALRASQQLMVTLPGDLGLTTAIDERGRDPEQSTVLATVSHPADLPASWLGYAGVHLVILTGDQLTKHPLPEAQLQALDDWIRMGGRLLFSAGESAAASMNEHSQIARFLPGPFEQVSMQREAASLEEYAGGESQRLDQVQASEETFRFRLPMAVLKQPRGQADLFAGMGTNRLPVVLRTSYGLGQIVFMACDLDQLPFTKWDGRNRIWKRLLDLAMCTSPRRIEDRNSGQTQLGFDDIVGQLQAALDQFLHVRVVPFSWIAVLIGLYIVLIGPLDYWFLRRIGKRFVATWITFSSLAIASCGLAVALTQSWKGNSIRVNQVDLVDIDLTSGHLRGTHWSHIYSPRSQRLDVELVPVPSLPWEQRGTLVSWQGLPGEGFGGLHASSPYVSTESYLLETHEQPARIKSSLRGLPLDQHSSRSLHGDYWGHVSIKERLPVNPLKANFNGQLRGEVSNPLGMELRDCWLVYGRWVYSLPRIPAGGLRQVEGSEFKTLEGMLTQARIDKDNKDWIVPWNRQSMDVRRILQMIMFHESCGGQEYTQLLHRFEASLDATPHIQQLQPATRPDRAILVGRTTQAASRLLLHDGSGSEITVPSLSAVEPENSSNDTKSTQDDPSRTTYYRLYFPVMPE